MNARRLFGSLSGLHRPPLSVLPNELLSEIFLRATHDASDRYESISTPITISQVSSRWRHVAISTRALWSTIIITFPTSRDQLSRAVTWLKRSQSYPLDIFLDFRDPSWDWELPESAHTFRWQDMEAILRLILTHVKRWKRFKLLTDTWAPIFTFLYYTRRVMSAPILESLSLSRCNAFFASKDAKFAPVEMKNSIPLFGGLALEKLREVSLTGVHVDWAKSSLYKLTALELMYLACDVTPSLDEFTNILTACPDLQHLTIVGRGPRIDLLPSGDSPIHGDGADDVSTKPLRIIKLSQLISFTFGFLDVDYALKILSLFSFPAIEDLVLEGLMDLDPLTLQNLDASPILRRLSRRNPSTDSPTPIQLSQIHSLKLIGINASKDTFLRLFDDLHDLEYLALHNTRNEALQALAPSPPDSPSRALHCATLKELECRHMDSEILHDVVLARAEISQLEHVCFKSDDINPDEWTKLLDAGVKVIRESAGELCELPDAT
ncbi:hypothetical protein FPV67DRAFT_1423717 [Lyophyllum atratum]|nr:hypothetical protein FPV67DRAFT_1423717 [Lyophyllum atratum]